MNFAEWAKWRGVDPHTREYGAYAEVWAAALASPRPLLSEPSSAALAKIGGRLNVSGQRGLRHIETNEDHPAGAGIHIASGKDEAMLNAIVDVCNAAWSTRSTS